MGSLEVDRSLAATLPPVEERTMWAAMHKHLSRVPDAEVVVDGTRSLSFEGLYGEALRLGNAIRGLGVARQEPVLVMLDNHVDHAAVWLGLGLSGAVSVPLNTAYVGDILAHVINDSRATMIVAEAAYLDRLADCASRLDHLRTVIVRGDRSEAKAPDGMELLELDDCWRADAIEFDPVQPWDIHSVMYTSGTTGDSKGAVVSHAQTFTRAGIIDIRSDAERDVSLVTLPLFHVVGQCRGLYSAVIYGARAIIRPHFSVSSFWPDVREHGVTYSSLLGAMATFLAKQPVTEQDHENSLQKVVMAPTIPDIEAFERRFGLQVITSYGSTEAGAVSVGRAKEGRCGHLHPEFEGRIVDEHDREVAPGEAGELVVRSSTPWTLTMGYWNRPEASIRLWRNLWQHTNDLFRMDEDGELIFVDRRNDMIRRRGENISASEVENIAGEHEAILECAAVAVPSEDTEDELKLVVALQPGASLSEPDLLRFLVAKLPYFMVPRYIELVAELPKTSTNKVSKAGLTALDLSTTWDREAVGMTVTRAGLVERDVRENDQRSDQGEAR